MSFTQFKEDGIALGLEGAALREWAEKQLHDFRAFEREKLEAQKLEIEAKKVEHERKLKEEEFAEKQHERES